MFFFSFGPWALDGISFSAVKSIETLRCYFFHIINFSLFNLSSIRVTFLMFKSRKISGGIFHLWTKSQFPTFSIMLKVAGKWFEYFFEDGAKMKYPPRYHRLCHCTALVEWPLKMPFVFLVIILSSHIWILQLNNKVSKSIRLNIF